MAELLLAECQRFWKNLSSIYSFNAAALFRPALILGSEYERDPPLSGNLRHFGCGFITRIVCHDP